MNKNPIFQGRMSSNSFKWIIIMSVILLSIVSIQLFLGGVRVVSAEEGAAPAVATIQVNAAKIVKPVNKKLFGTSMEEISRAQWVNPLDLSDPKLKAVLNELRPTMITLDNTQLGLPFFPENTGKPSERIGILEILEKIGIENDETGKILYNKLKTDPYFNKNQPQHHNYDDILQFLETLDVKPEISIRMPVMLADQSDKLVNLKLNLSPETGANLVHYLNDKETTALGKLRAKNGHPKPYNIKKFILGNEFWSNHDRAGLSIEQIASQYIGFSKAIKQADPTVKVGVNLVNDAYPHEFFKPDVATKYSKRLNYNDNILSKVGKYLDLVTFHVYGGTGEQNLTDSLNEDQWKFVLAQAHLYEKYGMAARHKGIADKYVAKPLIAIDEYSGPLTSLGGALYNADYLIYLMNNDYDLATNWHLGLMEPHTKFGLIKVVENKGRTSYIKRPNFYALKMFTNYFGDSVVSTTATSPTFSTQGISWADYFNWPAENDIPVIKTIASVSGKDGKELYLLIVNRDLKQDIKTKITINGFDPDPNAQVYVLNASNLNDTNETISDNVVIRQSSFAGAASAFEFLVEKHSVTVLKLVKKTGKKHPGSKDEQISRRLEAAIERVQKLSDRVAERLTKLEAEGVTTTVSRGHIAEAKMKLEEARTKATTVRLIIETASTSSLSKEEARSVQNLVKETVKIIQEAHKHVSLALSTVKPGINKPRQATTTPESFRVFKTSFESIDDFKGFYIVPQNYKNAASHDRSTEQVRSGRYSHKGWAYKKGEPTTQLVNNNHRGYPTIQLNKTNGGAFKTPVLIEFWVWLDMEMAKGEWFSFATLDHTTLDTWDPVLINLSDEGIVHTMHVPFNGQGKRTFQTTDIRFPMRKWVKLTACLDFDPNHGNIKVWQDDRLVSEAEIGKGRAAGLFTQAHFGLYTPPSVSKAVIYNDDLIIKEGSCAR